LRISLPSISLVVARSRPGNIIGRNSDLPWHLRTDLQRFKAITLGFPIIMGRKTYLSIGHPLPGRTNLVLTRNSQWDGENSFWQSGDTMLLWVATRETALFFADALAVAKAKSDVFVIGGTQVFHMFSDLFNKVYLTEVLTADALVQQPEDAIFDYNFDRRKWKALETLAIPAGPHDEFPSEYTVYERRTKCTRTIEVADYYTDVQTKKAWIDEQLKVLEPLKRLKRSPPLKIPYQFQLFIERPQSSP
jgi:dihydrofolate reductase